MQRCFKTLAFILRSQNENNATVSKSLSVCRFITTSKERQSNDILLCTYAFCSRLQFSYEKLQMKVLHENTGRKQGFCSLWLMEMEMVFNGYSLTGFSITIYNNIIIINTKILTYNKWHKNYLINIYVYIDEYRCVILS